MTWRTFWHLAPLLDEDFDGFGGELLMSQIIDPVAAPSTRSARGRGDPDAIELRAQARIFNAALHRRHKLAWLAARLRSLRDQLLRRAEIRLARASSRFLTATLRDYPKFNFGKNRRCNSCIPYNGHHTPNYWATGQADCW